MRHLGSLVLSLVLAPLIWVLTGMGLADFGTHLASGDSLGTDGILGLAELIGAGVLLAVLVLSRLSPLGVGLAGLIFIGMTLWAAVDASSLIDAMPDSVLGRDGALTVPAGGPGLLMGVPLVLSVLVPRRWRKHDRVTALYAATPGAPPPGAAAYGQQPQPYGGPQPTPGFGQPPYPTSPGSPAYPGAPASGPGYAAPGYGGAPAYAAPGSPMQPAQSFAAPTSGPPAAPVTSAPPATSAPPYYAQNDAATTRLSPPPPGSSPAAPPGYRPQSAAASDDATTRLPRPPAGNGDEPTQLVDDGGMTKSLRGTPPPPAAYPPPGHSTPTAPPTDPDATRQM